MKRKRKIGNRPGLLPAVFALIASGTALAVPEGKSRKAEPFALIAGSVFRDSGFSLAGAEVVIDAAPGEKSPAKFKRIKVIGDARGEFAVRVPPVPMRYTVTVAAKGFKPERKEIVIQGEERVDLFFRLEAESK